MWYTVFSLWLAHRSGSRGQFELCAVARLLLTSNNTNLERETGWLWQLHPRCNKIAAQRLTLVL